MLAAFDSRTVTAVSSKSAMAALISTTVAPARIVLARHFQRIDGRKDEVGFAGVAVGGVGKCR